MSDIGDKKQENNLSYVEVSAEKMYVDVANQVLQMALFARDIFSTNNRGQHNRVQRFFVSIHEVHTTLQNEQDFLEKYSPKKQSESYLETFYTNDARYTHPAETQEEVKGRRITFDIRLEQIYAYGSEEKIRTIQRNKDVADLILLDLLKYYDKDSCPFTEGYSQFLKTLGGLGQGLGQGLGREHLRGYKHCHIYLVLFSFKDITQNFFIIGEELLRRLGGPKKKRTAIKLLEISNMLYAMLDMLKPSQSLSVIENNEILSLKKSRDLSETEFNITLSNEYIRQIQSNRNEDTRKKQIEIYVEDVVADIREKLLDFFDVVKATSKLGQNILLEADLYCNRPKCKDEPKYLHLAKTVNTYFVAILVLDKKSSATEKKETDEQITLSLIKDLNLKECSKSSVISVLAKYRTGLGNHDYSKLQKKLDNPHGDMNRSRQTGRYFSYPLFF